MIRYKAEMVGIRVERGPPRIHQPNLQVWSLQKANRNGIRFRCRKCGYTIHADLNGAINIAKAISGFAAWHTGNRCAAHPGTF
jgi:transposase